MSFRALLLAAWAVGAAPPDWAVSGKWASCPTSTCWTGIGTGTSPDQARQAAMADISRQVRARIRSSTRDSRWEEADGAGEASSVQSEVRSDERIDGIRFVQQSEDGGTWYALATLDRADLAAPGRAAMSESVKEGLDRASRLRDAVRDGRFRDAVDALGALGSARRRFLDAREQAALGEPDARAEEFPVAAAVLDSFQGVVAGSLELSAPESLQLSREAAEPAKVPVRITWRGKALPGSGLELSDASGKVLARENSDDRGEAVLRPSGTAPGPWFVRVRPGAIPPVERRIEVRWTGQARSWRLRLATGSETWRTEVERAVERNGWDLSTDRGQILTATLKPVAKGSLEGMSGTVYRMEARLLLASGGKETTCASTATGSSETEAVRAALRKLDCPPF